MERPPFVPPSQHEHVNRPAMAEIQTLARDTFAAGERGFVAHDGSAFRGPVPEGCRARLHVRALGLVPRGTIGRFDVVPEETASAADTSK